MKTTRREALGVLLGATGVAAGAATPGSDSRGSCARDVNMGYHHNVAGDFLSLRPALFCAGAGAAAFSGLVYGALPGA